MFQVDPFYRATSSARNPFAQNPWGWSSIIFPQPLGDVRTLFPPAEGVPFPDKADYFPAHIHEPDRGFRAIEVAIDLVPDGTLGVEHPGP